MAGMRDRLIHDYFGVDNVIVFDVATRIAPSLARDLQAAVDRALALPQTRAADEVGSGDPAEGTNGGGV